MSYLNFQDSYQYFRNIADFGTITPTCDNKYDIKFIFDIVLARKVYKALLAKFPQFKNNFTFYKTQSGEKVIIGGRFPDSINMRKVIYDLKDYHKG
jgi:hypothetical protein